MANFRNLYYMWFGELFTKLQNATTSLASGVTI